MHLIAPLHLKEKFPLSDTGLKHLIDHKVAIKKIFDRKDPRLLMVIGPCSIHNIEEGLEYAYLFKQLAEEVKDQFFLLMRAYVEKPRTREGWKGLIHDPHLNGSEDIVQGLHIARAFFTELTELGVPIATEFLTPYLVPYIEDLVTWGCIGARTSSSPLHRLVASALSMPVGFKNSVDGDVDCAVDGVHVARSSHTFLQICQLGRLSQAKSLGNPYAHVVLRGSRTKANFDADTIHYTLNTLRKLELPSRLLIDCSHGNCQGKYFRQKEVFSSVIDLFQQTNIPLLGLMLESNLERGSQKIPAQLNELQRGVSITDPCIDFKETAELISSVSSMLISSTKS